MSSIDREGRQTEWKTGPRTLGPTAGQWVGVTANAGSGRGAGRSAVERLAQALKGHDLECRVAWTPDERTILLGEAAHDPSCRCIVAAGGDGTVSALVNERPVVPIAVLPAGTENLFAREFKASASPHKLARSIVRGHVTPLDLGVANDRRFSLMMGVGFDADVVTRHHRGRLTPSGHILPTSRAAYVEPVLRSSLSYRFPSLTIQVADPGHEETLQGTTAFVFNLPRYALGLPFAPEAKGDDGWLDLVIFKEGGPFRALHYLWLVLRGLHLKRDGVYHRKIKRVSIKAATTVPYQLDGDPGGEIESSETTSLNIEVIPRVIEVIVA